ncbi:MULTISPECIES: outer membrane protein assembly factor BamB family protein [Caballeronia]|uniref:outer membrane protein assembly factor BamB family protein n=1 Tax=Caballeronia TaxID=1827195 RepID=UPI00158EA55E|nr:MULTISPECIES: PQQ-binding-like beta-propeller repeat protein [Caballeronia]MCG7405715.1 PQQ-binding-like beta-propeller repeat protein [Caballeronia zhejiangensis]MCI1045192.1 PQQ-binding-like beta-propeller repeat protein [Caballeronia zhejiangensis]
MKTHFPARIAAVGAVVLIAAIVVACSGGSGDSATSSAASGGAPAAASSPSGASSPAAASAPLAAVSKDVVTWHNDIARTGQQLAETVLTPANVNQRTFGKLALFSVDGAVDAQPLFLAGVPIAGGTRNVLYVATENASVYAFDADSGAVLWKVSTLGSGESPSDDHNCHQITPTIGVTATPVIDRTRGPNGAMYVVGMSKDASGAYHQRIHALDVATGAELFNGPTEIRATYPGNGAGSQNGTLTFDPGQYAERAALLLLNGVVYTAWTSHCDFMPYTGWVMGYDAATLQQASVLNLTPNGQMGSIWMSGAGLASDGQAIFFLDANGTFDPTQNAQEMPINGNFGNGFLRLETSPLRVQDYFEPSNTVQESNEDEDLGSGGAMVLPDFTDAGGTVRHLAIGAGKNSTIYVVNRFSMGKFDSNADHIYQELVGQIRGAMFGAPAYFNNTVYFGAVGDSIRAFAVSNALLSATSTSQTSNAFGFPGATPSISANGTANGILWAAENGATGALHAYDAANLARQLYSSNDAGTRDQFGAGNKFITPMIANGKVYVGTKNGVAVFGLLSK